MNNLPLPVIATVAQILSDHYTHAQLDKLFMFANAPGDTPAGNKLEKCTYWLRECNNDTSVDTFQVLGKLIEEYMECEISASSREELLKKKNNREIIQRSLGEHGYSYFEGGLIRKASSSGPTLSLEHVLRNRDLVAVDTEFKRTIDNIESDLPASLTAACAIIEALCKVYIEDKQLVMPNDQSIKPLWKVVKKDLGFNPEQVEDQDLLKILSGLNSIVDGLGALRTHAGSAHGRGYTRYLLKPRHVRLAVHAAHTLATFVIETWDENKSTASV